MTEGLTSTKLTDPLDLIDETVVVFDLDLIITAWNGAAERLYGFARDEMIGKHLQATLGCTPLQSVSHILETIQTKGVWRGETVRVRKDQSSVMVRAKWSLRRTADGEPLDIVEATNDITELRRAEEAIERVEGQYQNMFRASAASFWELDFTDVGRMAAAHMRDGPDALRAYLRDRPHIVREMIRATKIVDINEQTLKMFGTGDRAVVMRSLDPFWPDESLDVFADSVVAAFKRERYFSAEVVFTALDGRRYETHFTVSFPVPLLPGSRILVGIVDLTPEKLARAAQAEIELRYRRFFENLPIPSLILDGSKLVPQLALLKSEGVVDLIEYFSKNPEALEAALECVAIKEFNPRTRQVLRADPEEDLVGSISRYWINPQRDYARVLAARYRGEPSFEGLVKLRAHDGAELDILFYVGWGMVTGDQRMSLCAFIDVTDRVRAETQLAAVQAEFTHAARVSLLGELTASIAHEVSQPLTVIATNTEAVQLWLNRTPPNLAEIAKLTSRTEAEATRAAGIISRIRAMAIRAEPQYVALNLNGLIEDTMLFVRAELSRSSADLYLALAPDLPMIHGDRVQLQQVIVNLCVNAMQAMTQAHSPVRRLSITTSSLLSGRINLEVKDTGPGIPDGALPRLFESFFTTKGSGMGIGLPICKSIVEAHGGKIVVSNGAPGAIFAIDLPAAGLPSSAAQ